MILGESSIWRRESGFQPERPTSSLKLSPLTHCISLLKKMHMQTYDFLLDFEMSDKLVV
jgi:hypothetical protein